MLDIRVVFPVIALPGGTKKVSTVGWGKKEKDMVSTEYLLAIIVPVAQNELRK